MSAVQERQTILLVDDQNQDRVALRKLLSPDYEIVEAADGNEAIQMMETYCLQLAAVLLDVDMPGLDGFEVLQIARQKGWVHSVPVFLIAEERAEEALERGYELGAMDILTKPFRPQVVRRRVDSMVELFRHRYELEQAVEEQTARIREQDARIRKTNKSMVEILSSAIGFRNVNSGVHVRRMRQITRMLLTDVMEHCPEYQLTSEQVERIADLSVLHDIGKIGVPDAILNKTGRLTDEEYECMKSHTIYGGELVERMDFQTGEEGRRYCYEICRHHHERWDGGGYPDGLKGEEIPIWVQAVSVADVYEALVSRRVYKPAYTASEAVQMILYGECGSFNPKILDALRRISGQLTREVAGEAEKESEPSKTVVPMERLEEVPKSADVAVTTPEEVQMLFELEQEKYRIIAELSEDMIFTYNALFDSMEFSEKFCKIFQVPAYLNEFSKRPIPNRTFYPEELEELRKKRRSLTWAVPEMEMDLRLPLPNGSRPWFHLVLHTLNDRNDRTRELGYVGKLTNINRIKKEATEWQKRANTDALTQLYNRAGAHILFEELRQESRQTPLQLTVAFMDIDRFKTLNDTLGHEAGDQILTAFGHSIRRLFRPDDIVSRFGGDEFLVVMKGMGDRTFAENKLGQLCRQTVKIACVEEPMEISSSIGVAFFPRDGTEFDDLLRKADKALYASKRSGRGRLSFYEDQEESGENP